MNDRPEVTDADVWVFMRAGCSASEIKEFAQVSSQTVTVMMLRAAKLYAGVVKIPTMSLAAEKTIEEQPNIALAQGS